jgi:hypothetical protein
MKFRKRFVTVGIALCSFAGVEARAECVTGSCTAVYVKQLYVEAGDQHFWLETTGNEAGLNCTPASGVLLKVPAPSKQILALLLSAQMADKLVNVRVNELTNPCTVAYVTLDRQ